VSTRQPPGPAAAVGGDGVTFARAGEAGLPPAGRHPTPWRPVFFGAVVLAILAGAGWALLGSSLLVVRHVAVTGNRLVTAAQVRQAAGIKPATPLATVNGAAIATRVERLAPVLSAVVSRSWPDGIVITVRERTPVLAVALTGGGYQLIDPFGVVVRSAAHRPAGMPLLSPAPAVLRGSPAIRAAAMVVRRLPPKVRTRLRWVSAASATAVTLHLAGRVTVLWGGVGRAAQKSGELVLLLRTHARYYDVSDPGTAVTQG
jgi:cell division protein FtsQ